MDQPHPSQDNEQSATSHPSTEPSGHPADQPTMVVIGPDGMAVSGPRGGSGEDGDDSEERHVTELVEQPAKVMRIGGMIRQLLEEVKASPLDEAARARLATIYESSIKELEQGLAPELVEELERLSLPFTTQTPSEAELRIAQAQLVGWLEGLFHGIQTAIYAQQMAARAQLEQMRRSLPPGVQQAMAQSDGDTQDGPPSQTRSGGMYL